MFTFNLNNDKLHQIFIMIREHFHYYKTFLCILIYLRVCILIWSCDFPLTVFPEVENPCLTFGQASKKFAWPNQNLPDRKICQNYFSIMIWTNDASHRILRRVEWKPWSSNKPLLVKWPFFAPRFIFFWFFCLFIFYLSFFTWLSSLKISNERHFFILHRILIGEF